MRHEYETEHSEVREMLEGSWGRLVARLEGLVGGSDQAAHVPGEIFGELEHVLRGHLRIEDELMLRPFELHDAREASALRAEHHELRRLLDEVAEELASSQGAGPRAQLFLKLLRNHSKRKLMRLFPWVDSGLRRHTKMTIVDRIRALTVVRRSMVEMVSLNELDEPLASSWA